MFSSGNLNHHVFMSFHRADVPKNTLSRILKLMRRKGIYTFIHNEIARGTDIGHELRGAIRDSQIAIVLLSLNYASSFWCLYELAEIIMCRELLGLKVMTVFYEVGPSDIKKQTGNLGKVFRQTCKGRRKDDIEKCRKALEVVATIAGEHSSNWTSEADFIEKFVSDISYQLRSSNPGPHDISDSIPLINQENSSQMWNSNPAPHDISVIMPPVEEEKTSKIRKRKSCCFKAMVFLLVINLVTEIVSVVSDQLSFQRISLAMSILSVIFSILDLSCKIREHKARFRCKWPIPWFYHPSHGNKRIFGSYMDTLLLFCAVGGLIVTSINFSFIEKGKDGPIKVSIWPLFFAIGMVFFKFKEKPIISDTTTTTTTTDQIQLLLMPNDAMV